VQTWLVLLRGINVGGKRPVPMAALRRVFAGLGYRDPVTYIASGNVIVGSPRARGPRTVATLERRLEEAFGHDLRLVVRTLPEVDALVRGIPATWDPNDRATRYDVIFLTDAVDGRELGPTLATRSGVDALAWGPHAIYWSAPIAAITRSAMGKLTAHPAYREMTIRNLRTTLAVDQLMRSHPSAVGSRTPRR
jgi:uncharacterized protein (DUF1697 family)